MPEAAVESLFLTMTADLESMAEFTWCWHRNWLAAAASPFLLDYLVCAGAVWSDDEKAMPAAADPGHADIWTTSLKLFEMFLIRLMRSQEERRYRS